MSDRDAALTWLCDGGIVAAPTETFFGLLADAGNSAALDRLAQVKPRGAEKGLSLIVPSVAVWEAWVGRPPDAARRLAERFWPGPLTLAVAPARPVDPRLVVDGTTAARVPGASEAAELARAFGSPLTATSANPPGEPPPADSATVRKYFQRDLAEARLFLVDGTCPGALPSTIVVVSNGKVRIVREGAIGRAQIEAVLR